MAEYVTFSNVVSVFDLVIEALLEFAPISWQPKYTRYEKNNSEICVVSIQSYHAIILCIKRCHLFLMSSH